MGVFSRYKAVLESDDNPMSVKTALQLINKELDEYLGGIQGEFDPDTRFAITWFEQNGLKTGEYGTANSIATARGIGLNFILSVFCLVWVADVFAYFGGRTMGRRKLAPAISPGKSWEGVWTGMAGVLAVVGLSVNSNVAVAMPLWLSALLALASAGVSAQDGQSKAAAGGELAVTAYTVDGGGGRSAGASYVITGSVGRTLRTSRKISSPVSPGSTMSSNSRSSSRRRAIWQPSSPWPASNTV